VAPLLIGLGGFVRTHLSVKSHALPSQQVQVAEVDAADERVPLWAALAAPPFAIPVAAMFYLRDRWSEIPARYPVHFGANGQPNRWVTKSERAVYAPLWFAEGLLLLMLLLSVSMILGSRRSARQNGIPQLIVAVMYAVALLFSAIGIGPLVKIPAMAMATATVAFVLATLIYSYRRMSQPGTLVESTPDECWSLGGIYSNPNDPALFVQKRIGYGFTVNFANPWSWAVLGGFFAGIAALSGYLIWAQR
jgi:uncharacterized membrane protein